MTDFTYSFQDRKERLEKYEWDNVWWECADDNDTPRVLYIGDSISCGTRRFATEVAENAILFDGVGTSKAVDNPFFPELIKSFANQQGHRKAILFNNGLHGWHLGDETEFKDCYEKLLKFLLEEFKGTPIFLVLTSSVTDESRNNRVIARNKVTKELAEKYSLEVIDFYAITNGCSHFTDGVHLTNEGYYKLANEVVNAVKKVV